METLSCLLVVYILKCFMYTCIYNICKCGLMFVLCATVRPRYRGSTCICLGSTAFQHGLLCMFLTRVVLTRSRHVSVHSLNAWACDLIIIPTAVYYNNVMRSR